MSNTTPPFWMPTRDCAKERLSDFSNSMGQAYASGRNYDFGPENRTNVSRLSPFLRRRLITEREVAAMAYEHHSPKAAEKYVQEVVWRTYFKGWLEHRPAVWRDYCQALHAELDAPMIDAIARTEAGKTGIACFDSWAHELIETNYLHNHARMWFASIWIFTLGLPWQRGADFFLRHLLDGDPASNTLSWRWVAGLHTQGKNYAASATNIAKFTDGRHDPEPEEFAQDPPPLNEDPTSYQRQTIRAARPLDPTARSVLLITVEDCLPETLDISLPEMRGTATLRVTAGCPDRPVAEAVQAFDRGALRDAAARCAAAGAPEATVFDQHELDEIIYWVRQANATQIVTAFIPIGPTRDWIVTAESALKQAGITVAEVQRDWDKEFWPHATAGFFKVKKKIPAILESLSERRT